MFYSGHSCIGRAPVSGWVGGGKNGTAASRHGQDRLRQAADEGDAELQQQSIDAVFEIFDEDEDGVPHYD